MNRFFRYSGSKLKYATLINKHIKTSKKIYVEPFIGSGALLFNLDTEFDKYIINDLDRNIVQIYKSFKEIDYGYYIKILENIKNDFGDIKNSKESYYNFRNWFNENHWNTNTTLEGIYLHVLACSCINSMFRFGKNGMNQSYGNCFYSLNLRTFDNIKTILNKVEMHNGDYKDLLKEDAFFFFDPPYFSQGSSYSGFTEHQYKEFLYLISNKEYLYTDILNDYNSFIKNRIVIREMTSTAPKSSKQKNNNIECLFASSTLQEDSIGVW